MIVESRPRFGGKTTALIQYMTKPGNQDVVYVSATEQQAHTSWLYARQFDPSISRERFLNPRMFRTSNPKRLVIDEADGTLDQLLGAHVEVVALTER